MRILNAVIGPPLLLLVLVCVSAGSARAATPTEHATAGRLGPHGASSYWVVTRSGAVCAAGRAKRYGNGHGTAVGIVGTADGKGFWVVLKDGRAEAFGDARHDRYRKTKLTRWSKPLGTCRRNVVGAAVAHVTVKTRPAPPTKTAPVRTTPTTPSAPGAVSSTTPSDTSETQTSTTPSVPGTVQTTATSTGPTQAATTPATTASTTPPPANPPSIETGSVAQGEVGVPYSSVLTAAGGTGGYAWATVSGALPPGLQLGANGAISGAPTTAGSYSFAVTVTANDGESAEGIYSLQVLAAVSATAQTLPAGESGVAYSLSTLGATGGARPYSWAVTGGALPSGVHLSSSGTISGTPTTPGSYSFTATVTDALGATSSQRYSGTVSTPVSVSTSELPDPVQTLAYDPQLNAAGGSGTDTWSVTGGALPAGVQLSSAGQFSGTPSTAGPYSVTVQVTDGLGGTASKTYSGLIAVWHEDENWSGYVETGANSYTSVSGTIKVPTLLSDVQSMDETGIWVGIDGANNGTLLQAGINVEDTPNGVGTYWAWTEMVPQQPSPIEISGFAVDPGDSISVSISETDPATQTWTLSLDNITTGQTYSTSEVYTGVADSAEWIAEATTSANGHLDPMAIWEGDIDFTNLAASQPATGLQYFTLSPGFVSGGAMNSLLDSAGFAVGDQEQVPPPLATDT